MTYPLHGRMNEILSLTRAGKLGDATALIQQSLGAVDRGRGATDVHPGSPIDIRAKAPLFLPAPQDQPAPNARMKSPAATAPGPRRLRHASSHGKLGYLLYVPSRNDAPLPLVMMLHGCTQSAEDFARGTRMNEVAEEVGFIVAYPEQTQSANAQKCWNWFRPGDQGRDAGEPALIAGITREIIDAHNVDRARVYVAGLSAGGAAAAIMADAYPNLYAAAGIHSGLACGSARDLPSAFAAMKGKNARRSGNPQAYVPLITFHGDRDMTVHPDNSRHIHAAFASAPQIASLERKVDDGVSGTGRRYRKTSLIDSTGRSFAEDWQIMGAGHAWSGGSPAGSYTDVTGPDASREMLRFLLQHRVSNRNSCNGAQV